MSSEDHISIFVKASSTGKHVGACPESQRILLLSELKKTASILPSFNVVLVNISRPPESFRQLGFRLRVPAIHIKNDCETESVDVTDDIVCLLESRYPGGLLNNCFESEADMITRNFFSRFCFYVRGVNKDSNHFESELRKMNDYLEKIVHEQRLYEGSLFLCGATPSLLDCEVLPKLHQARVALSGIIGYEIPAQLSNVWRYLHSAYNLPEFIRYCPPDNEILEHWCTKKSKPIHVLDKTPSYSFSVPVIAKPIILE